ncbi:nitrile hydratase subunit beta (plasmid) [Rhizobium jaguaris]|uniref:Nitrile hydratase subunit beta n=1 Tax=Rhizobium jaguaris TaxID=1312183 RepID=A0A387FU55_9HYPH|nr:nitrile hydratase subunit beta [Rhizobium jaguaris]
MKSAHKPTRKIEGIAPAFGELPIFAVGQSVKVSDRAPVAHYRAPAYLRGKTAVVEAIMEPKAVNNEEEAFVENTPKVHNLIVCTLCSCYPRPVLGLPPDWHKLKPYRARAVYEPRKVLEEFGTNIPDDVEIRDSDQSARHAA